MSREAHVRFCEGVGVRLPHATRLVILCRSEQEAQQALLKVREWTDLSWSEPAPGEDANRGRHPTWWI